MDTINLTDIIGQLFSKYGSVAVLFYFFFIFMREELNKINSKLDSLISLSNKSFGAMVAISKGKINGTSD